MYLWETCDECSDHLDPIVMAACASVGIERQQSTFRVVTEYLANYHAKDHK